MFVIPEMWTVYVLGLPCCMLGECRAATEARPYLQKDTPSLLFIAVEYHEEHSWANLTRDFPAALSSLRAIDGTTRENSRTRRKGKGSRPSNSPKEMHVVIGIHLSVLFIKRELYALEQVCV